MDERAIWETFDGLFKAQARQEREIGALRGRVTELEKKLADRGEEKRDEHDDGKGSGEAAA